MRYTVLRAAPGQYSRLKASKYRSGSVGSTSFSTFSASRGRDFGTSTKTDMTPTAMEVDQAQEQISQLETVTVLQGHSDRAWSVAWHPKQPVLASSSTDKQVRLYRFQSHAHSSFTGSHSGPSPPTPTPSFRFDYLDSIPTGHTRTVRSISWNPSGTLLASGSFDSTASIWSSTSTFLTRIPASNSRSDEKLWESEQEAERDRKLDAENDSADWECMMSLEGHESEIKSVVWNRNGKLLATCSRDKSVWIWEILAESEPESALGDDDGGYEVVSVLMEHEADVKSVCWSPKEDLLCSTSYDNHIHLYAEDVSSDGDFSLIHKLSGHLSTVWDASFSPCGEFLASCSDDLTIRLWHREKIARGGVEGRDGGLTGGWRIGRSERERWTCISVLDGFHSRTIYSLDWTFFGDAESEVKGEEGESLGHIATGAGDGKINVFEVKRGIPVSGLDSASPKPDTRMCAQQKHAHGVTDINAVKWCKTILPSSQAPVRKLLASAGDDGTSRVWRMV